MSHIAINSTRVHKELIGRLTEIRKARGLSQRTVAERCGVVQSAVTQWEAHGLKTFPINVLLEYADALGCDVEIAIKERTGKDSSSCS